MTYQELINLKFKKGISTYELVRRFPKEIKRVSEVALLDIPEQTLKEVVPGKKTLNRIMDLKKRFLKK